MERASGEDATGKFTRNEVKRMALFQLDSDQFETLTESIDKLSNNIAKWQAQQTAAIESGFASLIAALTGADVAEVQQRINTLTASLKPEADALEQTAQSNQPAKQGE